MRPLPALVCLLLAGPLAADTWTSPATGLTLTLQQLAPVPAPPTGTPVPVVFYLTNLAAPRTGTEADEPILRDLRAAGHLVVVLDYARHPRSRTPHLEQDLVDLRRRLQEKKLLPGHNLDYARIFMIPSGHRLKRDLGFYRGSRRTLALDLVYPSQPVRPVGSVLEFSCDNENRMGNHSLHYCTDTILPIAATEGLAVAMADHPVAAPYRGFDPLPDSAFKAKAAVRTLRAEGSALGLNGRIVAVGFSRGSGMALLLVTTAGRPEFEDHGEHPGIASDVQGAVVMSGRFTYLDLLPDDPMLPRYRQTWGDRTAHADTWRRHGALDYLEQPATVPLFLTINATESPDALHQMDVLRRRLTALGSPFVYHPETEPRGHKMPLAPAVLEPLHDYLQGQLQVASTPNPPTPALP